MSEIVLCPKCQVRVGKNNLGELLCSKCGIRLCPKAHIVDGKICPSCGWEDPNYYLWRKAQKAQPASYKVEKSAQILDTRPQQVCPRCGIVIQATSGRCSGCGWLYGSKPRVPQQSEVGITSKPKTEPQLLASLPHEPTRSAARQSGTSVQSPFLQELSRVRHREWNFTPIRRFLQPIGASLLVCAILFGVFILVKEVIIPLFSQPAGRASSEATPPPVLNQAKLYTLSAKVTPEGGGHIQVSPPSESGTFEPGIAVTLIAIPDECYTFSYWEGVDSDSSKAITTMDSNRTVTANFRLKDTTPPNISEVKISRCTDISATITWNTDEPAKSQIEYGKTEDYGSLTTISGEFVTSHSVLITRLEPNTIYYFKVNSQGKCGDEANTVTGKLKTSDIIPVGPEVGKRPPDFTLQEYQDNRNPESPNNGETVSLSDFRGKKILLNFWNTFCGACIGEFPGIRKIYEDPDWTDKNSQDSDLVILTVCVDGRADRIEKLEDKYQNAEDKHFGTVGRFTFPILLDVQEKTSKIYSIINIPRSFFIDEDGIIRDIKIGRFTSLEEIRNRFDAFE